MTLECCRRKLRVNEFKVSTTDGKRYRYLNEYILESVCTNCGATVIQHIYQTEKGKNTTRVYRGKKADKFNQTIKDKQPRFKAREIDRRMFLLYGEYGKVKKCYSSLSSLKIGLVDPYEGLKNANTL